MELLLINQFAGELESRSDVFDGQIVFAADILEGHAASEASDDDGDRRPRSADDRLAVTNGGIYCDAVTHYLRDHLTPS